ncbi:hypothetical protein ABW19_dt0202443 [Dactylella cylindrospora]|nr:hypothetical protein ABW19_dt0202443 [Dactylella cylindrospora]
MLSSRLLTPLVALIAITPSIFATAVPDPFVELSDGLNVDPADFNATEFVHPGPDFFDKLMNDPEIPFTDVPENVTEPHTLEKRALKRYNYLKFKVTLNGHLNQVINTQDPGRPWYFRCTSADLYIFDKIRRNARDIVLVWRNPNGGNAVPGSIFYMTNKRLYKFLLPGDSTEPVWYDDTVTVKWTGYNQLTGLQTYYPGANYNRRNEFTIAWTWWVGWALPEVVRSGGINIKWEDGPKKIIGAIDVQGLGYPLRHRYYRSYIDGQFKEKGYRYL